MNFLLWFSFALLTGVYICGPIVDPDLWWHLNIGRWIIAHAEIPNVDYWTEYGAGLPWRAYSWSNEIVLALCYSALGESGLAILKLLLGVTLAVSLCFVLSKLSRDWFIGSLLGVFAAAACHNHFTLRPQTVTWILFIWLIYFLDRSENEVRQRQSISLKTYAGIALIFCLWANTHITTFLGLIVVAFWSFNRDHLTVTLKLMLVALLGTLLTPYLGGEWLTFFAKSGHPFQHRVIAEFQPATIMQFPTGFMLIAFVLCQALLLSRPRALSPSKLFLGLSFVGGGLAVVKFLPLATVLLCALAALLWRTREGDALGNLEEGFERLRVVVHRLPKEGVTFVLLCLAFVQGYKFWQDKLSEQVNPVEAMDYFIDQSLPLPLLNDFGKGGYVSFRLSDRDGNPRYRVPIDGRTNVTPPEVFEEYLAAFSGTEKWHDYFDRVKPKTVLWRTDSSLIAILQATGQWCELIRSGDETYGYVLFLERGEFERQFSHLSSANCASEGVSAEEVVSPVVAEAL